MDLPLATILKKKVLMRQYILQADTHPFVKGVSFKEVWRTRVATNIKGQRVYVPSLESLIRMKTAAGREKDKQDLMFLKRVREKAIRSQEG